MTTYPAALAAHLRGNATTLCHCWKLIRKDGAVTGFTDHDRPLALDGVTFEPESGFSASEARDTLGLATDTVDVEGALSSVRIREEDISAGRYDGATVETLLVNWKDVSQFARLRKATIGRITRSDGRFVAELESLSHKLDHVQGQYVRRDCDAELGDARCKIWTGAPGLSGTGAVVAYRGGGAVAVSGLGTFAPGWFAHGVLTWTSGANTGRSVRILGHSGGGEITLSLWQDGSDPVAGNQFSLVAGCDKSFATCKAKFGNPHNFQGFPHLPGNDAGYAYVTEGGQFDGGPLVP
ncbi:DUF2163 domain-containing protein [Mesorhizobium sp. NBSH29]|uniref:DUF2163 domain-containing protein n=1 Tax=Mesorhizobium sp. NBSH29 TaxID=2654249 RepID=UPI0018967B1F|nr:DUF2163 domain-containing protein [Mesorhizobium sp. NBSH29]QPC87220.1 DUF2163 domain-containing protein [Mesorhizobium sp. NBSH29]